MLALVALHIEQRFSRGVKMNKQFTEAALLRKSERKKEKVRRSERMGTVPNADEDMTRSRTPQL